MNLEYPRNDMGLELKVKVTESINVGYFHTDDYCV